MIREIKTLVRQCTCSIETKKHPDGKPYTWLTFRPLDDPPDVCPSCKSRRWNGVRSSGRPRSIMRLPKPTKTRMAS